MRENTEYTKAKQFFSSVLRSQNSFESNVLENVFFSVFYLLVGEQLALKTKPILSTFNLCRPPPPRKTPTRTPTPPSVLVNFVSSSQNENIDCINSRRSRISRTRSLAHLLGGRKICVWPSVRLSSSQLVVYVLPSPLHRVCLLLNKLMCIVFCGITSAINVLAALEEREFTFENKA